MDNRWKFQRHVADNKAYSAVQNLHVNGKIKAFFMIKLLIVFCMLL